MRVEGGLTWCRAGVVRCSGARTAQSSQPHTTVSHATVDLMVLSDSLVADPRMVRDLTYGAIAVYRNLLTLIEP